MFLQDFLKTDERNSMNFWYVVENSIPDKYTEPFFGCLILYKNYLSFSESLLFIEDSSFENDDLEDLKYLKLNFYFGGIPIPSNKSVKNGRVYQDSKTWLRLRAPSILQMKIKENISHNLISSAVPCTIPTPRLPSTKETTN